MRIWDKPNTSHDWKCPICKTNEEKPVTLCAKVGTKKGNIMEAEQIHVDCINLYYHEDINALAMQWND